MVRKDNTGLWVILIVLGGLFVYLDPLDLELMAVFIPEQPYYLICSDGDQCGPGSSIDGVGGGGVIAFLVKVDGQTSAASWYGHPYCEGLFRHPSTAVAILPYVSSSCCIADPNWGVSANYANGCNVCPTPYLDQGYLSEFSPQGDFCTWGKPFTSPVLERGTHTVEGEFYLGGKHEQTGDPYVNGPITFNFELVVGAPVSCTDDPGLCTGDSECIDGVCVQIETLSCIETGCIEGSYCDVTEGICVIEVEVESDDPDVEPEVVIVTCTEDPSLCIEGDCVDGACVIVQPATENYMSDITVSTGGSDVAVADVEFSQPVSDDVGRPSSSSNIILYIGIAGFIGLFLFILLKKKR